MYNLIQQINNITIEYNHQITGCWCMFRDLSNITYIDLSNFDSSKVTMMNYMFYGCTSLKSLSLSNFITSQVNTMKYMFYKCSPLISLDLSNFDTSRVEWMDNMFSGCTSLNSLDLSNFDTSQVIDMYNMFSGCSSLISLDLSNFNTSRVEWMDNMFSGCSSLISLDLSNFDTSQKINITNMLYGCNLNIYIYFKETKQKNISSILTDFTKYCKYIFTDLYYCQFNVTTQYDMEKSIEEEIINGNLDDLINQLINNIREDLIAEYNNIKYEIITTDKNSNEYKNISNIKLGKCENLIKNKYNISENESLIIFKRDIYEEGSLTPKIKYDIFDIKNKTKLELDVCENIIIDILLPFIMDEKNDFKYNISSEYYNDICFPYTTEADTDIILSDRRNEYIINNMSLCENNCEYSGYNSKTKKVICKCEIKKYENENETSKEILLKNFMNVYDKINIKIMKCYKELFNKNGLINNIGSYTILIIILISILSVIFFFVKEYKDFNNIIDQINFENNNGSKSLNITNINNIKTIKEEKENENNVNEIKNEKKSYNNTSNSIKNKKIKNESYIYNLMKNSNEESNITGRITNNKNKKSYKKIINENKYNDLEINEFIYNDALKVDKRSYVKFYLSLLKRKHIILFTFFLKNDYNSRCIKICLFLFNFALYFTVNSLFFDDATMHKIFIDKGKYNFTYQIPFILYSSLISSIINIIIKYLSLSEKNVIEIKKNKNAKINEIKKCIKIKIILFLVINFLLLLLFWYYLSCFCAIYKNTQLHLLKDTLISFELSLLYPFGLCLIPGIFRIFSLRATMQDKECIYKISQFIQSVI